MDILTAAKLVLAYIEEKTKEEFFEDIQCQDAVIRRLEIIGEAARRISDKTKSDYSNLPWNEMIGMRNILIHEYDVVDLEVVWDTAKINLLPLVSALEKIVPPEDKS
ncbi:MAG: DUF86 domain-containing protein [bacterium]